MAILYLVFFFQAEDGIRDVAVTGVQTCALPISLNEFEQTGRIKWATDLAEIPSKLGVKNVYAEVGTAFANSAVADPRFAAAFVGTLVRGLGAEHVLWGTDSLWYGSPQWQIQALRRLQIPQGMQRK